MECHREPLIIKEQVISTQDILVSQVNNRIEETKKLISLESKEAINSKCVNSLAQQGATYQPPETTKDNTTTLY
jgi:hypothetical protein